MLVKSMPKEKRKSCILKFRRISSFLNHAILICFTVWSMWTSSTIIYIYIELYLRFMHGANRR